MGERGLECRSFRGRDGLRAIEPDWRALLDRIPGAGFHFSFEYFETLLACGSAGSRDIHFLCFRDSQGELVAVCPLEIARRKIRRLGFLAWQVPHDPDRPTQDFIVDPGVELSALAGTLRQALKMLEPRADLLALDRVGPDTAAWQIATTMSAPAARAVRFGRSSHIPSKVGMAELRKGLSRKMRANLRQASNVFAQAGKVHYQVASDPIDVAAAADRFLELEAAGWKGREPQGHAIHKNPAVRQRFLCTLRMLAESRACEVHSLWLEGEPVAALVAFLGGNELFAVKIAYSERWAKASPGHLLLERVLEACCDRESIESLNLGWEAGWSSSWRPEEIELSTTYAGLGGWRGRMALALLACQPRKARIQRRHS